MTWTSPAPEVLPDDVAFDMTGPEREVLQGMLTYQRVTLLNVCAGLTGEQLATRPLPSNLSLLGLLRHLAKVERIWLRIRVAQQDVPHLHDAERRLDTDFDVLDPQDAPGAVAQLREEWRAGDAAVADLPLDHVADTRNGPMSLRTICVHLIQEYARHNGHADQLREALDGVTER